MGDQQWLSSRGAAKRSTYAAEAQLHEGADLPRACLLVHASRTRSTMGADGSNVESLDASKSIAWLLVS